MAGFSIGAAWEDMIVFVRRESAILVPVAMATFGLGAILMTLAMPDSAFAPGKALQLDARLLLIVPALLLLLLGNLAMAVIALVPGMTVGEALRRSLEKMPGIIGAVAIAAAAVIVAMFIIAFALRPLTASAAQSAAILAPIVFAMMMVLSVPMLLLAPVVARESVAPVAALRRIGHLAKGHAGRLFLILWAMLLINLTVSVIATMVIGAVAKLAGMAAGQPDLVALVGDILLAAISAALSMVNGVYLAFVYKRIAG